MAATYAPLRQVVADSRSHNPFLSQPDSHN